MCHWNGGGGGMIDTATRLIGWWTSLKCLDLMAADFPVRDF